MNNLEIITNSFTPAKVDFNYKEIEDRLDLVLAKYKGLVFTEETAADCKRTMADLRKGQKTLDTFRKETKKKLTKSVTEFENDCKALYSKFDNVIDPLKEQADFFEIERRKDKQIEVQDLIESVAIDFELSDKYSKELVIIDKYLLSSTTMKKVREELYLKSKELKELQDQEELDIEFIKETITKVNKENETHLLEDSYLRLMEVMNISRIIPQIYDDVNKIVKNREEEKKRLELIEQKKLEEEAIREEERLIKEKENQRIEELEEVETVVTLDQNSTIEEETEFSNMDFESLPVAPQTITKTYTVTGTKGQIRDLEVFINAIFK